MTPACASPPTRSASRDSRPGSSSCASDVPNDPEFAAWRYGDQLGRRRRTALIRVGIGLGALGAVVAGGAVAGVGIGGFGWLIGQMGERIVKGSPERVVARLPVPQVGEAHRAREST